MSVTRPEKIEWGLQIAEVVATRSTCVRRKVGCVLLDRVGKILGTGYNGKAAGQPHCDGGNRCEGADAQTGDDLDKCGAIHAEQNALLQCSDVTKVSVACITVAPCITCTKLLMNTGCMKIAFRQHYIRNSGKKLWTDAGGDWVQYYPPWSATV